MSGIPLKTERAFTLLELLATLAIAAVFLGAGFSYITDFENRAHSGALELSRFFKQARVRGMASTLAYKVAPVSVSRVGVLTAANCSAATWASDSSLILDLPGGVQFTSTTWDVCYNSRGLPDTNAFATVVDADDQMQTVEVMLGGGIRIYDGY